MVAVWLLGAALAATTPQTGNASVDGFVADLAAGRRDAALARILEMNSLSSRPNAVALADEFVDKLLHCTLVSWETRRYGAPMYDLRWRCGDGDYFSLLDADYRPPRMVVAEFVSAAERERRRREPISVPPVPVPGPAPPQPSPEEKRQIVLAYLDGIRGTGAMPPGPAQLLVRFADGRPNAYIGPQQLRAYLAPCTPARMGIASTGNIVVLFACAGSGALDANLALQLGVSAQRVVSGLVWVGPLPGQPAATTPQ
jgi:hypothetical protein